MLKRIKKLLALIASKIKFIFTQPTDTMSLTLQRQEELGDIADTMYLLSALQRENFNEFYNPDIVLYGCSNLPSTSSENISALSIACTGLSHEEIEYVATELKNKSTVRAHIGIKPGSNPSGSPSGNK